jgi:hypothetical protein
MYSPAYIFYSESLDAISLKHVTGFHSLARCAVDGEEDGEMRCPAGQRKDASNAKGKSSSQSIRRKAKS